MSPILALTLDLCTTTLWNGLQRQVFQLPGILIEIRHRSSQGRNPPASTLVAVPPLVCRLDREECLAEKIS